MPRTSRLISNFLTRQAARSRTWLRGAALCGGILAVATPQWCEAGVSPEAVVHEHQTATGETGFALGMKADRARSSESITHVVLVDTSASQLGDHREHSLAVLHEMLTRLPSRDRVEVVAYDVEPVAITRGFLSPQTAASVSRSKLARRVPAGAGNLMAAIRTAQDHIEGRKNASITVIGDGMSVAELMDPTELASVLESLREDGVAIHTYGVGSTVDKQVLGLLAQQTGGAALIDDHGEADEVGYHFAQAVRELPTPVMSVRLGQTSGELLNDALPLRSDRLTYLVGIGDLSDGDRVVVTTKESGNQKVVVRVRSTDANNFLVGEVRQAQRHHGDLNALAGDEFLTDARQTYFDQLDALASQGQRALESGQMQKAEMIAQQLLLIDPSDRQAGRLLEAATAGMFPVQAEDLAPPASSSSLAPPASDLPPPAGQGLNQGDVLPGRQTERSIDPISEVEELIRLKGEKLTNEVSRAIQEGRELIVIDTQSARAVLQQARGAVKSAGDVEPELQERLIRRLNAELAIVDSREESLTIKSQTVQEVRAELEAQERLVESLVVEEERLKQLSEQVRALMSQGFHGDPEAFEEAEAVARVIVSQQPNEPIGTATLFNSEAAGQLDKAFRLRAIRADQFLATLYQVELSHIPFPDEPPVLYPSAAEWQRKTELREKWRSVDLHQNSPNEARITRALDSDFNQQFIDTPLGEAIDFLAQTYDIPIIIKETVLQEELGISKDETFTLAISGIKLRNALNIILREQIGDLQYYIKDEILWITSETDATDSGFQTRVYPVADLVIAIEPPQGGGLGGGLGGGGGGFGGGGGGGFGGGGGGFGGGGFGGGGQGAFSVPSAPIEPAPIDVEQGKKKAMN